jgi:hypothetical protein
MICILKSLKPRICFDKETIYEEHKDLDEVLLFESGNYDMGYEIDRKIFYKLRFKHRTGIGAFYVTFGKRTMFFCRAHGECRGYSIFKRQWLEALKLYPRVGTAFK